MGGVGGVTSRNAQSSRLASQLAVKKKCHTFHEKSHLLPAQSVMVARVLRMLHTVVLCMAASQNVRNGILVN
eukprot:1158310-Pelagomonas_calceolata.AAC.8